MREGREGEETEREKRWGEKRKEKAPRIVMSSTVHIASISKQSH